MIEGQVDWREDSKAVAFQDEKIGTEGKRRENRKILDGFVKPLSSCLLTDEAQNLGSGQE